MNIETVERANELLAKIKQLKEDIEENNFTYERLVYNAPSYFVIKEDGAGHSRTRVMKGPTACIELCKALKRVNSDCAGEIKILEKELTYL